MAYFILLFWLFGFYFLWRIPPIKQSSNQKLNNPSVSIVIPARNEEGTLEHLLESLSLQKIELMEIIVVDDQSEDATAKVAERFGHKVILSNGPPRGWLGKPWACWQGAQAATFDILLFLDADVVLSPDAVNRLCEHFSKGDGLLSVQPYHFMKKNYERLSAIFNIVAMAGMNAFTVFGSALKTAGAFGPCNMCRKKDYFEVGGHKAARMTVLESLALGNAFRKAGYPIHCFGGKGAVSFRMYPHGMQSLVEGFSKGFATGATAISIGTMVIVVCWIFGGVSLTRHLIEALIDGNRNAIMGWLMLDLLYAAQIQWMLMRIGNFGIRTALFFQIPLLFFVLIFTLSLFKATVLRRSRWKGRIINTPKGGSDSSCD